MSPRRFRADVRKARQHDRHGHDADRDVDLEDPPPAEVVGDEATRGGADDRAEAEHAAEQALDAAAILGREEVANDCEDGGEQHAAEDALDASEHDQLRHVLRQPAHHRRGDEADHAREQEWLAAEEVAELARDRGHRGRGHEVCRGHPGEPV
jgi:hypothetical protein